MSLQATVETAEAAGRWRVIAHPADAAPVEITAVRGAPTGLGDWTLDDPFGPGTMSLTFPAVSLLDTLGEGDLAWLADGTDVDIFWDGPVPPAYPGGAFAWEGYIASAGLNRTGVVVQLKGALHEQDDFLAKPEYLTRPVPYELAIARQWDDRPSLRTSRPAVEWPGWWSTRYAPVAKAAPYNIPSGVRVGALWSGLVTRETGAWDPVLTSYVQTLLASMYTDRGRFTLELRRHRRPVITHKDFPSVPDAATVVVDLAAPGVEPDLSVDWSQRLSVVYGQGKSRTGESFTGQQVVADGSRTFYRPLAALRQVHPTSERNGWLQASRRRKEVLLQVQQGLDLQEAQKLGSSHLAHFSDPGITGSITLTSDPGWGAGGFLPRALVKQGMTMQLKGALGRPEGVLVHVVSVSTSLDTGTTTCQVDSKFRDKLTLDEVRERGRDGLSISRLLIAGGFQPVVSDQLLPWSYSEGSGFVPGGPQYSSQALFSDMPDDVEFPFEGWTITRPPKDAAWKTSYMRIGPRSVNADENWARVSDRSGGQFGFPIKLAQAGSIRLLQLAAYDRNGNVLKVPFHFGVYQNNNINVASMPKISTRAQAIEVGYPINQHHPFFEGAWETYRLDGTKVSTEEAQAVSSSGMIRAWGTKQVPAGYWPGTKTTGDTPTGLLVSEEPFEFNLQGFDRTTSIDPFSTNQTSQFAGYVWGMIYCEAQGDQEVFFAGRMFRVEPGSST